MPLFASKLSPEQWAEARRQRAEGATYEVLSARFGVRPAAIRNRARKEGWAPRGAAEAKPGKPAKVEARAASPATAEVRHDLALKLCRIIGINIQILELRMTTELKAHQQALEAGEPLPALKDEREAFAALIEQINQVTEMASEPDSAAPGRRKSVNPELTALSDELDPAALAAASAQDTERARLAEQLAKAVGPA
jgi:hypothetical protein